MQLLFVSCTYLLTWFFSILPIPPWAGTLTSYVFAELIRHPAAGASGGRMPYQLGKHVKCRKIVPPGGTSGWLQYQSWLKRNNEKSLPPEGPEVGKQIEQVNS